ncbi:MAG: hypothetical protein GX089_02895 [Fibrobacter sp.]|jgi:hypothetical protein|nr:hypothetical protein [Fibrobacter sp.]
MLKWISDYKRIDIPGVMGEIYLHSNAIVLKAGSFSGAFIIPAFIRTSLNGKVQKKIIIDITRLIQIGSFLLSLLILTFAKRMQKYG